MNMQLLNNVSKLWTKDINLKLQNYYLRNEEIKDDLWKIMTHPCSANWAAILIIVSSAHEKSDLEVNYLWIKKKNVG